MNKKVFVFDLDGTLYEDTHHFEYYAMRLKDKLAIDKQEYFINEYRAAVKGQHPLQIGRVYDVSRDLILIQENNLVREALTWDGTKLSKDKINEIYKSPITINLDDMLSVGDLWWVPGSIARHYGLNGEQSFQAFLETREYMMTDEFKMTRVPGFKESLEKLKKDGINLALLTNSPEKDSEVILTKLGLENIFDKKIFNGKKPSCTRNRFQELRDEFNVDFQQIVSIGDNWINEILPAKELGCHTIYIDTHEIGSPSYADYVVKRISDVIPLFEHYK